MRRRRSKALAVTAAAALLLLTVPAGTVASASAGAATIELSPPLGPAGTKVTVSGVGYAVGSNATLPVTIRWNSLDGPVMARAVPNAKGAIAATFTVPDGLLGYYVVLGVQRDATGADTDGTPTRSVFQIVGPAGEVSPLATIPGPPLTVTAPTVAVPAPAKGSDPGLSVPLLVVVVVLVGAALALPAAGRLRSRSRRPSGLT